MSKEDSDEGMGIKVQLFPMKSDPVEEAIKLERQGYKVLDILKGTDVRFEEGKLCVVDIGYNIKYRKIKDEERLNMSKIFGREERNFVNILNNEFEFNKRFIKDYEDMSQQEVTDEIMYKILQIEEELSEVLELFPWKKHKDYGEFEFDREHILEEFADVAIFTFAMVGVMGFSAEEFADKIIEKNKINIQRQEEGY